MYSEHSELLLDTLTEAQLTQMGNPDVRNREGSEGQKLRCETCMMA